MQDAAPIGRSKALFSSLTRVTVPTGAADLEAPAPAQRERGGEIAVARNGPTHFASDQRPEKPLL